MKEIMRKKNLKTIGFGAGGIVIAVAIAVAASFTEVRGPIAKDSSFHQSEGMMADVMSSRAVMKTAPTAAMSSGMASMSPTPQDNGRRVEESHNFRFKVDRDLVADQYERAFSACSSQTCEVVNGNLNVQGVTKSASLTVRIEPDDFNRYMDVVGDEKHGVSLVNHSRSAVDRTNQYQDIEARLNSQKELRSRLKSLVHSYQGQNIRSLLEIERELARVQGQIESMEAQMRGISIRTDRITASINFFSDHLSETPDHPPYLKNALKEVGVIFESNTAKVVRFVAAILPYVIGLTILFAIWIAISALRRRK